MKRENKAVAHSYRAGLLLIPVAIVLPIVWMALMFSRHGFHRNVLYFGLGIIALALVAIGLVISLIKKFNS